MMFYTKKDSQKSKLHPGIKLLVFFFIFAGIILLGNYIQKEDELKLKDSIKTKAVITKIGSRRIRRQNDSYIKFNVKNEQVEVRVHGDWTMLNVGDTVEIIYSKLDPTIFRVTDKNYEKKKEIIRNL